MEKPKVGDIVQSRGGRLIGKVVRMWGDGCIVDYQYEDNDDDSPCFGEEETQFDEIDIISAPSLVAYLILERGKEKKIQRLWPTWWDNQKSGEKIKKMRCKALEADSHEKTLAGLDKVIKELSFMYQKDIRGGRDA